MNFIWNSGTRIHVSENQEDTEKKKKPTNQPNTNVYSSDDNDA